MADTFQSSDLCTRCSLCCSGALFNYIKIDDTERERIEKLNLDVYNECSRPSIKLPCRSLEGRRCSIYEERPRVCRTYRCVTLMQFEQGEIDAFEADRRVTIAVEGARKLKDRLQDGETIVDARLRVWRGSENWLNDRSLAEFHVLNVSLNRILDLYFRSVEQRWLSIPGETN